MKISVALKLGRTSNLPTIWTNTLTALALTGLTFGLPGALLAAYAMSLFYFAGMYFNDVIDVGWDKKHKNNRPIVLGEVSAIEVAAWGTVFFFLAFVVLFLSADDAQRSITLVSGIVLLCCILLYDWQHKHWSAAPWIMGACRMWVYLTVAATLADWDVTIVTASLGLCAYVAGITFVARTEHLSLNVEAFWSLSLLFLPAALSLYLGYDQIGCLILTGILVLWLFFCVRRLKSSLSDVPRTIGFLLAGICLVDASFLASQGYNLFALLAVLGFGVCLILQRFIAAS